MAAVAGIGERQGRVAHPVAGALLLDAHVAHHLVADEGDDGVQAAVLDHPPGLLRVVEEVGHVGVAVDPPGAAGQALEVGSLQAGDADLGIRGLGGRCLLVDQVVEGGRVPADLDRCGVPVAGGGDLGPVGTVGTEQGVDQIGPGLPAQRRRQAPVRHLQGQGGGPGPEGDGVAGVAGVVEVATGEGVAQPHRHRPHPLGVGGREADGLRRAASRGAHRRAHAPAVDVEAEEVVGIGRGHRPDGSSPDPPGGGPSGVAPLRAPPARWRPGRWRWRRPARRCGAGRRRPPGPSADRSAPPAPRPASGPARSGPRPGPGSR